MKTRKIERANTLEQVLVLLSKCKYNDNVWVGKNYSLGQLVQDLESIMESNNDYSTTSV